MHSMSMDSVKHDTPPARKVPNAAPPPLPVCNWQAGDAAFIDLAGGPIRANWLMRAVRSVPVGTSRLWRGIRITGVPFNRHRVERDGHGALVVEQVDFNVGGRHRTAIIWHDH